MGDTDRARNIVEGFFIGIGDASNIDEEFIDYITSILTDDDMENEVEDLDELISSASAKFAAFAEQVRHAKLGELLDELKTAASPDVGASSSCKPAPIVLLQNKAGTNKGAASIAEPLSNLNIGISDTSRDDRQACCSTEQLQGLLDLCGAIVSPDFLLHMLTSAFKGSLEQCADWLIECQDLPHRQASWEAAVERERDQRREAEEALAKHRLVRGDSRPHGPPCPR